MDDDENNDESLQNKAANTIFKHVKYQPPEYLLELWNTLGHPPAEWPHDVCYWLRLADANFWNKHLPPPPPDNQ